MKFRGHAELNYADWALIGAGGIMLYYNYEVLIGIALIAIGIFLHSSMN